MIKLKISDMLGKYKMTQLRLSELSGIRGSTVSNYYHDKVKYIDIEHLDKFCKIFKCQPSDIMEYIED